MKRLTVTADMLMSTDRIARIAEEVVFENFDFEADAWEFLYDGGWVACLDNHRKFDHPDGRHAVLIPGDERDPQSEVKIFPAKPR